MVMKRRTKLPWAEAQKIAQEALRLKQGEIKEMDASPEVVEMAKITPWQDLQKMARTSKKLIKTPKKIPFSELEHPRLRFHRGT